MSLESIQQFVEAGKPWVDQHGLWIVALAAFGECMLVAGTFVPGFAVMLAAGYYVANGTLMPHTTIAAAWTGALLGVTVSFGLGRRLGGTRHPSRMHIRDRLSAAMAREGPAMLLWYVYASPIRLTLPWLAGANGYPWRPWLLYNAVGVLPWMAIQLGIGFLSYQVLSQPGSIAYWAVLLATTGLTFGVTAFVTRRILHYREGGSPVPAAAGGAPEAQPGAIAALPGNIE